VSVRGIRLGRMSIAWRPRHLVVVVAALAAALAVAVVSAGVGDFSVAPSRVLAVLVGGGERREELVVYTIRLPRILVALLVGVALGVSGAVVQTTARNSLASPDLLGITAGASVGAVGVIVLGGDGGTVSGLLDTVGVPAGALVGGLLAAALVLLIIRRTGSGGLQPILVGVGVSALLGGLVSWMMVDASINDAARANVWLTGSLNGRSWGELWPLLLVVLVCLPLLVPLSTRLGAIDLGADVARGLGVSMLRTQGALLVLAVLLASVTTAAAGPIAFVALVSPHLARLASGASRPPLAASAAIGALLVVSSDLIARTVLAPIQVPVGAITALVGAPFLLWLLIRTRREVRR
jgi:iron complex transport system permease protein